MSEHDAPDPLVSRRRLAVGGATLVAAGLLGWRGAASAGAQEASEATPEPADGEERAAWRELAAEFDYLWTATSPATREGDEYALVLKNDGTAPQTIGVRVVIMDHVQQRNVVKIMELVELAPGEERVLTTVNDYGLANHFNTVLAAETTELLLAVSVTDAAGRETARFTEGAFMVRTREELREQRPRRRDERRRRRCGRRQPSPEGFASADL